MDVRVEVKIPGGVESYVVDLRGEKYVATRSLVNIIVLDFSIIYHNLFNCNSDMKQLPIFGKKPIFLLFYAPYFTQMMSIIDWLVSVN